MGRRRSFDRDEALRTAMFVFWENEYEQTSIRDLAAAMGIGLPSLYAAFGDKRSLLEEAVRLYRATPEYTVAHGLEGLAAREATERMLRRAATVYSDASHPLGCLVQNEPLLAKARDDGRRQLRALLAAEPETLADAPGDLDATVRFYGAVLSGLSSLARDGASRGELFAVAEQAMAGWPDCRTGPSIG